MSREEQAGAEPLAAIVEAARGGDRQALERVVLAVQDDVFGLARSHGCVNLAPVDGQKLYRWTDPQVPPGWHSVETQGDKGGTTVVVHE